MAKIMIVDDAAFMRGSLKYIVESAGHNVIGMAQNGKEAVKLYRKLNPTSAVLNLGGGSPERKVYTTFL
ncbi:MAG: hypothetical protein PHV74_16130 [Dehalococcoidia bacterium]|nr:hypothetical protein [Dehalococcoidia bacterium]